MRKRKVFALGFFDGVHQGHQALLAECVRLAKELNIETAAITFLQHPQSLFVKDPPPLINTDADRDRLLQHYGIRNIYKLPVTKEVMSTPWERFLEDLLEQGAAGFVCGDDFRFGSRGEGDGEKLTAFCQERGLPCTIVPEQAVDGVRISSTYIRRLLEGGEMETAVKFLGHPHILSGEVVPGRKLGRTIGIPTANILLPQQLVQPKLGVYACKALVDGEEYLAVTNIGSRPTVGGHQVRAESWLLDFAGDLYGKEITLAFHSFLREEQKFSGLEELQKEIRKNGEEVRKIFENS